MGRNQLPAYGTIAPSAPVLKQYWVVFWTRVMVAYRYHRNCEVPGEVMRTVSIIVLLGPGISSTRVQLIGGLPNVHADP